MNRGDLGVPTCHCARNRARWGPNRSTARQVCLAANERLSVLFRAALGRPALTGATALAIVSASTAAVAAATAAPGSVVNRLGASDGASAREIALTGPPFSVTQGRRTSRVYDAVQTELRDQRLVDARRAARAAYRKALLSKDPKIVAKAMLARFGWGPSQFSCLDSLWTRESKWSVHATNPSSGAYGIPQALPGSKMSSAGPNWRTNAITQISWGLGYIRARYGTPCGAWSHSEGYGWY
jgi:hypothetical protein